MFLVVLMHTKNFLCSKGVSPSLFLKYPKIVPPEGKEANFYFSFSKTPFSIKLSCFSRFTKFLNGIATCKHHPEFFCKVQKVSVLRSAIGLDQLVIVFKTCGI